MKKVKEDWLILLVMFAPFVFIAIFWDQFPDKIPTHFNLNGQPDDYSDKATGLFMLPGINIILYFVFIFLPLIDPSRRNYGLFADKYKMIRVVLHVFFSFIFFITASYSLGFHFNMSILLLYGTLVLFLFLGNYMGSVRHNYFVGIRTPWTLANEEVWKQTHRLAAKIWVAGSLIMMVLLPFLPTSEIGFLIYLAVITLVPAAYSFLLFRKIGKAKQ